MNFLLFFLLLIAWIVKSCHKNKRNIFCLTNGKLKLEDMKNELQ